MPDALKVYHESLQVTHESHTGDFSSDDETEGSDKDLLDDDWGVDNSRVEAAFSWTIADGDLIDDGRDLTAEELLGEDFEREAAGNGEFSIY